MATKRSPFFMSIQRKRIRIAQIKISRQKLSIITAIKRQVGFRIGDVDRMEAHTDVVAVEIDAHCSSRIETFGLNWGLDNDSPAGLVEVDLIGGNGISHLDINKKLGKSGGVDSDISVNRYAVEVLARGEEFLINVADAVIFRP